MDGGDRAGYKQIANVVDAILIGPSTGSTAATTAPTAAGWSRIKVISSGAAFAGVTAAGLTNSSKITSATTWPKGAEFECNMITSIKLSSDSTDHAVIAFNKILL